MWDRGHCFIGAEGAGSCMHVDQAWWSNVAKNFRGHKLVATWGPEEAPGALAACGGQLFRRPLSSAQRDVLCSAARVALLRPGDVASFSGGLPHITAVVGDHLNFTAYESFINWSPANARLFLRGAARKSQKGTMGLKALHGLFEDMADAVHMCEKAGAFPARAAPPADGSNPKCLLAEFRAVLLKRRCFARRLGAEVNRSEDGAETTCSSSDSESNLANPSRSASPSHSRSAKTIHGPASKRSRLEKLTPINEEACRGC